MKKLSFALVGAAALALAACGGQGDDALGENVQEIMRTPPRTSKRRPTTPPMAPKRRAWRTRPTRSREEGENAEEAIDEADVNAANVNAM